MTRRGLLLGLPACGLSLALKKPVWAGSAHPLSLPELVSGSRLVLVGTPTSAESHWEKRQGGQRIVTYTRVEVLSVLSHQHPSDSQLYVRTLGGKVGDIGQIVHGEAELALHGTGVLFLHDWQDGVFGVTGLAQGHYPLENDDSGTPRLHVNPGLAHFVAKDPQSAVNRLRGRSVGACQELVVKAATNE